MYDFVRSVYPAADVERTVEAVFRSIAKRIPTGSPDDVRLHLFAEARAHLLYENRAAWPAHNAHLVRRALLQQGSQMSDWHAWEDLNRVMAALERVSVAEQEALAISNVIDDLDAARLAVILRTDVAEAGGLLASATTAFREAFDDAGPNGEPSEVGR